MEKVVTSDAPEPCPRPDFWRGKTVLITGHTGFKGAWLAFWLVQLGARVHGVALAPDTDPSLFTALSLDELINSTFLDIRNADALAKLLSSIKPDIVFHLAAQPLVRASYEDPAGTFATNVMGTAHVLEAVRKWQGVKAALMITTDKVYHNRETRHFYREDDQLGGHDPYSASKAACEILIESYRKSFFSTSETHLASARAGNVIGGGDWAIDRIIPDAVRAWLGGQTLVVRRPDAIRPWQHVLEALCGYLVLTERLWSEPALQGPYNFGPPPAGAVPVRDVVTFAQRAMRHGDIQWGIADDQPHEAGLLMLDIGKAAGILNYRGVWTVETAVTRSIDWYRRFAAGTPARKLCLEDIEALMAARA